MSPGGATRGPEKKQLSVKPYIMSEKIIIGLDIGGTKTAVVLGTPDGEIISREQFPTLAERGFQPVFDDLVSHTRQAITKAGGKAAVISISVGGPLDAEKGIIKNPPNLPCFHNIPLKDLLSKEFNLPVYIEHDAKAGALAEFYFGAGRGFRNIIFVTMGTGMGAGFIFDGKLYRGTTDTAGEIWHVRIAPDGPEVGGKRGAFEGYASGTGISKLAKIMHPDKWGEGITTLELYTEFKNGSREAKDVFDKAAEHIGLGFANLIDTLNPERIIMGGLGMRVGDAIMPRIKEIIEREALPVANSACEIVPAELGEQIGDVASLSAAIEQGKLGQ